MIQSDKYITKINFCPNCWKQIEWTLNEEEYNYLGRPIVKCPECGTIIQADMKQILQTQENDGTPPIPSNGKSEMITVTFKNLVIINGIYDENGEEATRQYLKGEIIQELPTIEELNFTGVPAGNFCAGWTTTKYQYEGEAFRVQTPIAFNSDVTLYCKWETRGNV